MNNKQGTISVHEGDLSALWRPAGSQKPFALTADVALSFLNIDGRWFSRFDSMFWESPEKVPLQYGVNLDGTWASEFHRVVGNRTPERIRYSSRSASYAMRRKPDDRRAFTDVCWGLIEIW